MTPERWRRVKQVFGEALDVESGTRAAALARLCRGDESLHAEVRSLIEAHESVSAAGWLGLPSRALTEPDFVGNDRFAIEARLGAGGFGIVYRALDRERGRAVALKVLRERDGAGLVRFKREFRVLADLIHPHLVRLHELFAEENRVFFTMELVEGRSLVEALRTPDEGSPAAAAGRVSWSRSARALRQLLEGVRALHGAGILHRDLKPSNVLVTGSERVVILDFGLATDRRAPDVPGQVAPLSGTPAYMAPEQFVARVSSEASDLYALGVMLYELLAGRLPFEVKSGALVALVDAKAEVAPPLPPEAVAAAPSELARLCTALLAPDPAARPHADEVDAVLAGLAGEAPRARGAGHSPGAAPFVGRAAHLATFRAAWARARGGELAVVCARGSSGMGKTALVRRFLAEIPEAVVLTARCHEREALAYKALDGVVDGVSQLLKTLPLEEVEALRPDGFDELARLFPVLRTGSRARPPRPGSPDATEQRRRAFGALRELLVRLSTRHPVVVFIDDLQWGDDDSAALLRTLLRPPDAPALMLVAACRRDVEAAPAFASLLEALAVSERVEELAVDALRHSETRELVARLIGEGHAQVEPIAAEAAGVPFFIDTLVEELRDGAAGAIEDTAPSERVSPSSGGHELRLRTVLAERVRRLPAPARRLLEVVALAGKPMARGVAQVASGVARADEDDLERLLRARHLVRLGSDGASLETYHDRVRESVTAGISAAIMPALHGRVARALAEDGRADPEDLAHHLAAAGERAAAAQQAMLAAERRAGALAFDRAAVLYGLAIELGGPDHPSVGALAVKRAEALAAAGHSVQAGEAFLAAADKVVDERAALTCRGAEQLLRGGEMARGRALMARLLRTFGWRVPRTALGSLLAVLVRRAELALRGLRFPKPWRAGPRTRDNLLRMDASWALASSAMMVDTVRATYFQTHHLRLALEEGEPFRLARALGLEAISASLPGARSPARADRIVALLREVTGSADHPVMNGLAPLAEGIVAANRGLWRLARERSLLATEVFAAHGAGVAWELSTARSFLLGALVSMGEFREYSERFPAFLDDSRTRGDLYAEAILVLSAGSYIVRLKEDRAREAESEVDAALGQLAGRGFQLPKLWALFAKVDIALYVGDAEKAWHLHEEAWPRVSRSLLLLVQTIRLYIRHQRARVALAMAARAPTSHGRARFHAIARKQARALAREGLPWSSALARTLHASLAYGRGDLAAALATLGAAADALAAADMGMHAAGARHVRGRLLTGPEGGRLAEEAEAWMRAQGVRRPERVAALVCPGFGASS